MRRASQAAGLMLLFLWAPASAQERPAPFLPERPPAPFSPDASEPLPRGDTDTWIFSGVLQNSREAFSGTLVTGGSDTEFELKLAGGATCDGQDLLPETGLVRLPDITCSDDRTMRALFVPQGGHVLEVFGHVGDERFTTTAHLLGTEPIPEKRQTTAPKADPPEPSLGPAPQMPPHAAPPDSDPG